MKETKKTIEELKKYLEENHIKPSHHRLKILEYLMSHKTHPTVDMIYKELSKEMPTLSKTTIYSTLKLFQKKEIVTGLTIDENELRFDSNTTPHGHFKCIKCNRVFDISIMSEKLNINMTEGHKIVEHHIYFKGVCKDCLKMGN